MILFEMLLIKYSTRYKFLSILSENFWQTLLLAQLTQRKKVLKQARHIELIKEQFRHIQEQFAADSKYVFPSLEHLELYQRYLLRLDEGLSVELEEERTG